MSNKFFIFSCLLVLFVGFVFRFKNLSSLPGSLSIDEVSFGINAESIRQTGMDENGKSYPISFKALGDYKLPVTVYIDSLSISILGHNEFALRFPTALFGSLTSLFVMFISIELGLSKWKSITSGLFVATSGWHIFLSRGSFETVTALFFLLVAVYLFLKYTKHNHILSLTVSAVFFGMTVWTYNSFRIFTPLLITFLVILYRKKLKVSLVPLLVWGAFFVPLFAFSVFDKTILGRANDLWFSTDLTTSMLLHHSNYLFFKDLLFDNDLYITIHSFIGQYLAYFSPLFWFWRGLNLTTPTHIDVGIFSPAILPLLIIGAYRLIISKEKILKKLVLFWVLVAPLAPAFTKGDPSHIRIAVLLPAVAFIVGYSISFFSTFRKKLLLIIILLCEVVFQFYFWDMYSKKFTVYFADQWHYGYKEAANYACDNHNKYTEIVLTDKYGRLTDTIKTVPYMYLLWYCNFDMQNYLKTHAIYNIVGRQPQWRIDDLKPNMLLIGSPWDFPEGFPDKWITKKIYFPDGRPALFIVETSSDKNPYFKK